MVALLQIFDKSLNKNQLEFETPENLETLLTTRQVRESVCHMMSFTLLLQASKLSTEQKIIWLFNCCHFKWSTFKKRFHLIDLICKLWSLIFYECSITAFNRPWLSKKASIDQVSFNWTLFHLLKSTWVSSFNASLLDLHQLGSFSESSGQHQTSGKQILGSQPGIWYVKSPSCLHVDNQMNSLCCQQGCPSSLSSW